MCDEHFELLQGCSQSVPGRYEESALLSCQAGTAGKMMSKKMTMLRRALTVMLGRTLGENVADLRARILLQNTLPQMLIRTTGLLPGICLIEEGYFVLIAIWLCRESDANEERFEVEGFEGHAEEGYGQEAQENDATAFHDMFEGEGELADLMVEGRDALPDDEKLWPNSFSKIKDLDMDKAELKKKFPLFPGRAAATEITVNEGAAPHFASKGGTMFCRYTRDLLAAFLHHTACVPT